MRQVLFQVVLRLSEVAVLAIMIPRVHRDEEPDQEALGMRVGMDF